MDDDDVIPVLAHGMLQSLTSVRLSLHLLRRGEVDGDVRAEVATASVDQIRLITDSLSDLARGLPVQALLLLQGAAGRARAGAGAADAGGAVAPAAPDLCPAL